jgi:hypothetical protein
LYILLFFASSCWAESNTIYVPLTMSTFAYMPQDGPTGSTPDPTDPNQFRVSLTGNTLLVETQKDAASCVVIQETQAEYMGEDYFYGISNGEISCSITRAGEYVIYIGYWNTNFVGILRVEKCTLLDFNGHVWGNSIEYINQLPEGFYIFRIETKLGTTTAKFYHRP